MSIPSQHVLLIPGKGERQDAWRTQSQQCLKDSKGAGRSREGGGERITGSVWGKAPAETTTAAPGLHQAPTACAGRSSRENHHGAEETWPTAHVPPHWKLPLHGAEQCSKGCRYTVPQKAGLGWGTQKSLCPVSLWVTSSHCTSSSGPQEDTFLVWISRL